MKLLFLILAFMSPVAIGRAQEPSKLLAKDIRSSERIVTGAPFTADAETNSIQMLADGTRISSSARSKLYRDAEGRFRRDDSRQLLNVPGANVELQESILIIDPVSGYRYSLDKANHTYRQVGSKESPEKMKPVPPLKKKLESDRQVESKEAPEKNQAPFQYKKKTESDKSLTAEASSTSETSSTFEYSSENTASGSNGSSKKKTENDFPIKTRPDGSSLKSESLGSRTIEGVNAEGTRTTLTIPIGAIGNDRAITVVYEKWYSNEIEMTVLSRQTDPRFGEQNYRLTNISRAEPPLSLFAPPGDFKRIEANGEAKKKTVELKPLSAPVKPSSIPIKPSSIPNKPNEPKVSKP